MSPALPIVSGAEAVRALAKVGFVQASQRGSHVKLRHDDGRVAIVPLHKELARGALGPSCAKPGSPQTSLLHFCSEVRPKLVRRSSSDAQREGQSVDAEMAVRIV